MPYGYVGDISTKIKQSKKNNGVLSVNEVADLQTDGNWGGSMELIEAQTVSGVSSVIFDEIQESRYDIHFLQATNWQPAGNDYLAMRFYESGTIEDQAVYEHALQYGYLPHTSSGAFGENKSTGVSFLRFLPDETSTSTDGGQGYCYIYNAGNSSKYTLYTQQTMGHDFFWFGGGVLPQTSTVDGIYLFGASTGSNMSGTFKLYGVKQT